MLYFIARLAHVTSVPNLFSWFRIITIGEKCDFNLVVVVSREFEVSI